MIIEHPNTFDSNLNSLCTFETSIMFDDYIELHNVVEDQPVFDFLDDFFKCTFEETPGTEIVLNIYFVSKGLRRMCLYCGIEISSPFREWILKNGYKYEIKMIYDDRDNCYFLNINDSYIHMGIPSKEEIGTLLEYYQPYKTTSPEMKYVLTITYRGHCCYEEYSLFSQFSTERFPKEYISALLAKFSSVSDKIGYTFGYQLLKTSKGSDCQCSCCK